MLEVLEDFPSAQVPLAWLLQIVPRLQPRYFSIASSLRANPGRVHILAALVDYLTPHKRRKRGVCSAWLSGLQPGTPNAQVSSIMSVQSTGQVETSSHTSAASAAPGSQGFNLGRQRHR